MDKVQADNYISIIRTAIFKKPFPLSNPDWGQLAVWAKDQSMTALFYTGASGMNLFPSGRLPRCRWTRSRQWRPSPAAPRFF